MTVTAFMATGASGTLTASDINDRVYCFMNYLNDGPEHQQEPEGLSRFPVEPFKPRELVQGDDIDVLDFDDASPTTKAASQARSEESRAGQERGGTGRSRWTPSH